MTALLMQIEEDVKRLSRADRERLLSDLSSELEDTPLSEIDQAWIDEADRRFDDLASGRVTGIPTEEVFTGIRRELGWKK